MRVDQWILSKGLVASRAKAQELIGLGAIQLKLPQSNTYETVKKASYRVLDPENTEVKILNNNLLKYVSRAGLKLEGAFSHLNYSATGLTVLDLGQSTGGFTDCALHYGAEQVVGVDVGVGQLHETVKNHQKVTYFEGINARHLSEILEFKPYEAYFDLVVMDVSFISMTKLLTSVYWALKPGGELISLVKPQFELDKKSLNKKGIVKSEKDFIQVENNVKRNLTQLEFQIIDFFQSPILGGDGNKEFFVYAKRC